MTRYLEALLAHLTAEEHARNAPGDEAHDRAADARSRLREEEGLLDPAAVQRLLTLYQARQRTAALLAACRDLCEQNAPAHAQRDAQRQHEAARTAERAAYWGLK